MSISDRKKKIKKLKVTYKNITIIIMSDDIIKIVKYMTVSYFNVALKWE